MKALSEYSKFLRKNFLEILKKEYSYMVKDIAFPLLQFPFPLDRTTLIQRINTSFDYALHWMEKGAFVEKNKEYIGNLPLAAFSKKSTSLTDLVELLLIHKQVMIIHIPEYTKEADVSVDIVQSLEEMFMEIEKEATNRYIQLKEEEIEKLKEAEVRLKLLMEESRDMVFVYSGEGKIIYISPCVEAITGLKPEELISHNINEMIHPVDLPAFEKAKKDFIEKGTSEIITFRFFKKDQSYVWMELKPCLIRDGEGDEKEIHAILKDISDRLENEKKLQLLAAIVEFSSDAIFSRSKQGSIQSWNPGAEKLLGYTANEITGKHYSVFVPYALNDELAQIVEGINKGEPIKDMETVCLKKDGTPINVSLTISTIRNELNDVIGESVVVRDITKRLQMENALLESEQKYRQIVEEAADIVYASDAKGNFIYFNPAFKKHTGYEPQAFIGKHFTELVAPKWKEKVRLFYKEQFTKKISETVFSFPYVNSKGEQKWVEQTVILQKHNNWVSGFQSVVRDITDRKKAVEALKESEGRLRQFLEALPIGIIVRGQDGKIYFANKRSLAILGVPPPGRVDKISKTYGFHVAGTDDLYPLEKLPIVRALKGEFVVVDDIEAGYNDKKTRLQAWGSPVYDSKGNVAYAISAFDNITERKLKEQEILTLKSNLSTVIENIPANVLFFDPNNKIVYFNENMSVFYKEMGIEIAVGGDVFKLVPPDTLQYYTELNKRVFAGEKVSVEQSFDIGGKKRHHLIKANPVFGNDKVIGACLVGLDITERIKAEEEIKRNEEKLRKFMEDLPIAIYILDKAGKSYYANKKSVELLGKGVVQDALPEELPQVYQVYKTGSNELYPFNQLPIYMAMVGERAFVDDMEIRHPDKSIPIQVNANPVFDEQGHVEYAIATFEDITNRKKMEQWQAEMVQGLGKKNKELNDFAFVVSHDLKAPLRAIGAISSWIHSDYYDKLDEEGKNKLNLLVEKVHLLDKLIDGILHYSQIGRITESKVEINMENLIHEQIELLSPPPDINIQIETPMPVIYIDKTLISQVFQNLISNAIKFMDKPVGNIRIGCIDKANKYIFYVVDNGPGIDEKNQEKIFNLFQSVSTQEKESAGIGLTIVKKIIESKNGKIWVESKPGEGSTFFFILPKEEVKAPIGKILQEA